MRAKYNKKMIFVIFIIMLAIFMTGCGKNELEDKAFPLAIGFDTADKGKLKTVISFPDLSEFTQQDKSKTGGNYVGEGKDFETVEKQYLYGSQKKADYGHMKCIIISENLLKSGKTLENLLSYLNNNPKISQSITVVSTKEDMEKILEPDNYQEGSAGEYIQNLIDNTNSYQNREKVTLGMLIRQQYVDDKIEIPVISLGKEKEFKVKVDGYYF